MDVVMRGERKYGTASLHLSVSRALPKSMRQSVRELTSLYTPMDDRRKGLASLLMKKVCNEADNKHMVLLLTPDDGLSDFYKQFGFTTIQHYPKQLMARTANG